MDRPSVTVVGSINTDLVVATPNIPRPGETVLGDGFAVHRGGKGANQAVAAGRMGSHVRMIGCVGDDSFGSASLLSLADEGLDVSGVVRHPTEKTGVAFIAV
ncbi:MAG: PfkB family carbohydrate kinase, partial [Candidatus Latescibacteria bacterium]|nr:PfkB family carbohydrate kinase [Candidatus Latescibacterota bacterium]